MPRGPGNDSGRVLGLPFGAGEDAPDALPDPVLAEDSSRRFSLVRKNPVRVVLAVDGRVSVPDQNDLRHQSPNCHATIAAVRMSTNANSRLMRRHCRRLGPKGMTSRFAQTWP